MSATRGWTLRQRVTALCVVVGLALTALAAAAAVVAETNRRDIDAVINRAGPLRADAESLMTALVDQETGIRGFAVSGRESDLGPYQAGVTRERELVASMEPLLDGQPEARQQLRTVQEQAAQWRQVVAEPVVAAVRSGGPAAGRALLTDATRQRFDTLRQAVEQFRTSMVELRREAAGHARSSGNTLVLLLVVAATVVLIAGAALLYLLDRMVSRPVTELAAQVREVARGDYDRRITSDGSSELARLAADIDGMRRQIAADLSEVRTARGKLEEAHRQLETQADELTRSNRDLEQFAYVASHDLQEPLRKVASFCQLLQRRYAGQLDERADQYIAFAVDGAQRMQRLINDLLAFSRIGRLTAGFAEVDLDRVMGEVANQLETVQESVGGQVTWSGLPVICGEEPLLTTLLANLAGNSLKFHKPGVTPKVHVSARRVGDEWEITCRDNGIGIEQEFADKVFVIFQRLHAKDAYPGTGIGLAIAKKIVEYHGGRIWLDPEYHDGAAISFTLPVLQEDSPTGETTGPTPAEQVDAQPSAETADTEPAKETVA